MASRPITALTSPSSAIYPHTPTALLLSLPFNILCGIDLLSFTTTPQFRGIKDIPPGWHFIFTSETSSLSIRDGFWFFIPPSNSNSAPALVIREWDAVSGSLRPIEDAEDELRWRKELPKLWERNLSPYRQSASKDRPQVEDEGVWKGLAGHVTPSLLTHLTQSAEWIVTTASCAKEDRDEIPGLGDSEAREEERELGTLGIDLKRTWREGAVGRERTEGAVDRSWKLEEVVERWKEDGGEWGDVILGQVEVCWVMVLTVACYSALEEWKRCIGLVLTCRRAVKEREEFFARFLGLVGRQMGRGEDVEGGLFEGGDLLRGWLMGFKRVVGELFSEGEGEDVKEEMEALEKVLKNTYGWELGDEFVRRGMVQLEDGEMVEMEVAGMEGEDESGEYAPVIVDLDGNDQ